MIGRRGFLGGILAACAAPAIVKSSSLMKLWVPIEPPFLLIVDSIPEELFANPQSIVRSVFDDPKTYEELGAIMAAELYRKANEEGRMKKVLGLIAEEEKARAMNLKRPAFLIDYENSRDWFATVGTYKG